MQLSSFYLLICHLLLLVLFQSSIQRLTLFLPTLCNHLGVKLLLNYNRGSLHVHEACVTLHNLKSEVMDGSAAVHTMKATNSGGLPQSGPKVIWAQLSNLKGALLLLAIKRELPLLVSGIAKLITQSEWIRWLIIVYDTQTILICVFFFKCCHNKGAQRQSASVRKCCFNESCQWQGNNFYK